MSIAPVPTVPRSKSERAFMVVVMLAAGQFFWVFVTGLFAGGQFHADEWPRWDPVAPWPVLPIPAWLTTGLGCAATVAAVLMVRRPRQHAELPVLVHLLVLTLLLLVGLPVLLAALYGQDDALAAHWAAAVPQAVTVVAIAVRIALTARRRRGEVRS